MLYSRVPQLDLHGLDRDYSRILINEFVADNYMLKHELVVIVHGIGTGILKKTVQDTLRKNKLVKGYKIDPFNVGQTIVEIKKRIDTKGLL